MVTTNQIIKPKKSKTLMGNCLIAGYNNPKGDDQLCPKIKDLVDQTMTANNFVTIFCLVDALENELEQIKLKQRNCYVYKEQFSHLDYIDRKALNYIKYGKVLELSIFFDLVLDLTRKKKDSDLIKEKSKNFFVGKRIGPLALFFLCVFICVFICLYLSKNP
jgi:hypothetical protein